nr:hypothetical protein [Providencia rettgeri]
MIKTVFLPILFGFIGAGIYSHLKPPKPLVAQIAVINMSNPDGSIKSPQERAVIQHRADILKGKGFIIFNQSALHTAPDGVYISGKLKDNWYAPEETL